MRTPELFVVPVRGGSLRVARWPGRPGSPLVAAAHGVTANHRNFSLLAELLGDDVTLVAPDLRGRGGSNALPPPFGMRAHAEDLVAVLDHLGASRAVLVGHSMGGFVVPTAAVLFPDRVSAVVVVDGGLPVVDLPPDGTNVEEILQTLIGPSLERLKMTFETREAYHEFWKPHPALDSCRPDHLAAYFDYDLVGSPGEYRSGVSLEAALRDSTDTLADAEVLDAIERVTQPFAFLWATRGIFDQTPGFYDEQKVGALHGHVPHLESVQVDSNHWSILFGAGASVVAEHVRKACGA